MFKTVLTTAAAVALFAGAAFADGPNGSSQAYISQVGNNANADVTQTSGGGSFNRVDGGFNDSAAQQGSWANATIVQNGNGLGLAFNQGDATADANNTLDANMQGAGHQWRVTQSGGAGNNAEFDVDGFNSPGNSNNPSFIDQNGTSNTAVADVFGNGNLTQITQDGLNQDATVNQGAGVADLRAGSSTVVVRQFIEGNTANVDIDGGTNNDATVIQDGVENTADVDIALDTTADNFADVSQTGNDNTAIAMITGGSNNRTTVRQTGNNNVSSTSQNGSNNVATVVQQ